MSPQRTDLTRIVKGLGRSDAPRRMLRGLLAFREFLASAGIEDGVQWLPGSFAEEPEAIVVTFYRRPERFRNDNANWEAHLGPYLAGLKPEVVKAHFHWEAHFVDVDTDGFSVAERTRYWHGLFSHRMLEVSLARGQDDADAAALVEGDIP